MLIAILSSNNIWLTTNSAKFIQDYKKDPNLVQYYGGYAIGLVVVHLDLGLHVEEKKGWIACEAAFFKKTRGQNSMSRKVHEC